MNEPVLSVRELEVADIDLITAYWLESEPDFLVSLGVDLAKLPGREALQQMLYTQLRAPVETKAAYALIWLCDGQVVGHCNVNKIVFGREAYMHLHMWKATHRRKGMGSRLVRLSLPWFFEKLQLRWLYCEPYAQNPAPNRALAKAGFTFEKSYLTVPGAINFEQEVHRWTLSRSQYEQILAGQA